LKTVWNNLAVIYTVSGKLGGKV